MGTFAGHALPGGIFMINGISFICITLGNTLILPEKRFSWIILTIEFFISTILPLVGIILEHVAYVESPHGHLCSPSGAFRDPHNWHHTTMYLFFLFFGVFRTINYWNHYSFIQGNF